MHKKIVVLFLVLVSLFISSCSAPLGEATNSLSGYRDAGSLITVSPSTLTFENGKTSVQPITVTFNSNSTLTITSVRRVTLVHKSRQVIAGNINPRAQFKYNIISSNMKEGANELLFDVCYQTKVKNVLQSSCQTLSKALTVNFKNPVSCIDSDNGKNYVVYGKVTVTGKGTSYDICTNNKTLSEMYCSNNALAYVSYTCPYMCKNGVCVAAPVSNVTVPVNQTTPVVQNQTTPIVTNQTTNVVTNNTGLGIVPVPYDEIRLVPNSQAYTLVYTSDMNYTVTQPIAYDPTNLVDGSLKLSDTSGKKINVMPSYAANGEYIIAENAFWKVVPPSNVSLNNGVGAATFYDLTTGSSLTVEGLSGSFGNATKMFEYKRNNYSLSITQEGKVYVKYLGPRLYPVGQSTLLNLYGSRIQLGESNGTIGIILYDRKNNAYKVNITEYYGPNYNLKIGPVISHSGLPTKCTSIIGEDKDICTVGNLTYEITTINQPTMTIKIPLLK